MYMQTLPLALVRANLSKIVDEAISTHERVEITRNGSRAAVVMSAEDYDSLIETLDILGDPGLLTEIRQSLAQMEAGDVLTSEEVLASLSSARRGKR